MPSSRQPVVARRHASIDKMILEASERQKNSISQATYSPKVYLMVSPTTSADEYRHLGNCPSNLALSHAARYMDHFPTPKKVSIKGDGQGQSRLTSEDLQARHIEAMHRIAAEIGTI
jgi:hypothetical protein